VVGDHSDDLFFPAKDERQQQLLRSLTSSQRRLKRWRRKGTSILAFIHFLKKNISAFAGERFDLYVYSCQLPATVQCTATACLRLRCVCVLVATCVPGNACAETDSEANVCAWKATVQSSKDEEDDHRVIPRHEKYSAECRLRSKPEFLHRKLRRQ